MPNRPTTAITSSSRATLARRAFNPSSPEILGCVLHLQVLLEHEVTVELQQHGHRGKRPRQGRRL